VSAAIPPQFIVPGFVQRQAEAVFLENFTAAALAFRGEFFDHFGFSRWTAVRVSASLLCYEAR
jgi:hypothetical protein